MGELQKAFKDRYEQHEVIALLSAVDYDFPLKLDEPSGENGLFRPPLGTMRFAENEDGRKLLLWSPDREALLGDDLNPDRDYYIAGLWEKDERIDLLGAATEFISNLRDALYNEGMLFKTSPTTWESGSISYKIEPDKKNPVNEAGENQFRIQRYTQFKDDDKFAKTDGWLAVGYAQGTYTEHQVERFIAEDLQACKERMLDGKDPVSPDHITNPALRSVQKVSDHLRETPKVKLAKELYDKGSLALEGPMAWLNAAIKYVFGKYVIDKLSEQKTPKEKLTQNHKSKTTLGKALPRLKDEEKTNYKPISVDKAGVRTHLAVADQKTDWAQEWLFGALQSGAGAMVTAAKDCVTVDHPSGLTIKHLIGENKAYASYDENRAVKGADPVPDGVKALFDAPGKTLVLSLTDGKILGEEKPALEARQEIAEITGNEEHLDVRPTGAFCRISSRNPRPDAHQRTHNVPVNKKRMLGQPSRANKSKPSAG